MKFRNRRLPETEDAPPPPVAPSPWRVPPPGSMGDAWDALIVVPEPPVPEPPRTVRKRKQTRRTRPDEVILREFRPMLHPLVAVVWVVVALGLFSTGSAYPLMPVWGLVAVFGGAAGAYLLRHADTAPAGRRHCVAASVAGLVLIVLDGLRPNVAPYNAWFVDAQGGPAAGLTFEDRIDYANAYMPLLAKAAMCGYFYLEDDIVAVGRDGINRDVRSGSQYFRVSTLAWFDGKTADLLVYAPGNVPTDPFADDPTATFGVYLTEHYVLVYSIGPDGEWQINPRKPVERESRNPKLELKEHLYDAVHGTVGRGDILKVYPLETEEGLSFFCDEVRQEFEAFGRGERIKVK